MGGFLASDAIILLHSGRAGVINRGAMKNTPTKKRRATTPGFAIPLTDSTNLGLATLIAEDEEGHYEPVSVVSSISEAREIAASDLRGRMRGLERDQDPGLCPHAYTVWANGIDGDHRIAIELPATSL